MSKKDKKNLTNEEQPMEKVEEVNPAAEAETAQQPGQNEPNFTPAAESAPTEHKEELTVQPTEKQTSSGKGIALLALLIALGIGGAGYYFGSQKLSTVEQQIAALAGKQSQQAAQTAVELPSFEAEKAQLAELQTQYQQSLTKISTLEREQAAYTQKINSLQQQLQQLGSVPKAEPTVWLLADADFLLNNALRKMVLDNDLDATKSLLNEADNVLSQVSDSNVLPVRDAIKADLNQLASLNDVDQNSFMQRLGQLANRVDDMPLLDHTGGEPMEETDVSDSITDWQQNIEKSANSFLNHFIRISDKNSVQDKVFIAPNQEVYLRENIRLRLQIAILAVPRQQNELYKQSLEAVGTWVRSYFDVQNDNVKAFLKELDDLAEQSIYIDAPTQLQSLILLEKQLNKTPKVVEKVDIEAETALPTPPAETLKNSETTPAATPVESAEPTPAAEQPATAQ